jgi:methanogenic corrinoid protein MtbC1
MSNNIENIKAAVVGGEVKKIERLVNAAINEGIDLSTIINNSMIAAMNIVGRNLRTMRYTYQRCLLQPLL